MVLILGIVVIVTVVLVLVAIFILWLTDKVASAAVTDQFRDAEFILEHHRAPAAWAKPRGILAKVKQSLSRSDRGKAQPNSHLVRRLDELIEYFERSPFFEDEESRDILLEKLREERSDWEHKSPEEIVAWR